MEEEACTSQESEIGLQQEAKHHDIIEPINRKTVHRICSGQVVLSLAIAVKELVENSVDASATNIEVRLKDYGADLLEVSDNGGGVKKENFQALTLKHYTSKLREFEDLESVETLGFRGEALSSLCALSNLTITTKHTSAEHATRIQYDLNGKIVSETPAAREIGTTVSLENLFSTLPVRRKEFTKNLKREYSKMCQLLYAYCLVSKGIKFMCTNQTKVGSRSTVVATEGSNTVRENIINIFGARQISSLMEVTLVEPDQNYLDEFKVKIVPGEVFPFNFECIISSAAHGSGRSTSDRQFFYINSRPCEPNKIMKLVNEVYKQFNSSQYPFVFLNITMQRSLVDVNVTPDKRQIFLEKEKLLLAVLKSSLLESFKDCPSSYRVQNLDITNGKSLDNSKRIRSSLKRPYKSEEIKGGKFMELFKKKLRSDSQIGEKLAIKQSILTENKNFSIIVEKDAETSRWKGDLDELISVGCKLVKENQINSNCRPHVVEVDVQATSEVAVEGESEAKLLDNDLSSQEEVVLENKINTDDNLDKAVRKIEVENDSNLENLEITESEVSFCIEDSPSLPNEVSIENETDKPPRPKVTVRSSLEYLHEALKCCQLKENNETVQVRFRSQIVPSANEIAEQELQKQISKDMFEKMQVLGQFNLGFIITRLKDDLFIIDQHATDEKYNFEQLQLSTVLESQVLVNPKPLELTAANEEILIENLDMFRKNGFNFLINADAVATKKVSLTAIPMSKNYIFGKDDIEEMLFMLQEDVNHTVCRPSRVRSMFASRACRKSVMVGCPLSQADMRRLVDHMGEIDQPWNCPHGRPTMRHLINLKLIQNT